VTVRRLLVILAAIVVTWATPARADYLDHLHNLDDIGKMKVPRTGSPRILVLPVIIEDQNTFEEHADDEAKWLADVHRFFETDGAGADDPFTFPSYIATVSIGLYTPTAVVVDPVRFATCPPIGPNADCAIPRGGGLTQGNISEAAATLRDALRFFDEVMRCAFYGPNPEITCTDGPAVDPRDFDLLGAGDEPDGFIDGVVLVSNAPFPGIALPVKDLSENTILQGGGSLPQFTYEGVTVGAVAVAGREFGDQRGTWVAVHELGHLLGFADLYNESGATTDLPWSLMGGWFYAEPASLLDAFSRTTIGWARLEQVEGPGTYELQPAWSTGHVLKIGTGNEFFLAELRVKRDDVDGDLDDPAGVAVLRVSLAHWPDPDEGGYLGTLANCVNCDPFDALLMVEEADGEYDMQFGGNRDDERDLFHAGDSLLPSDDIERRSLDHPVSSTNLLSGRPTGISITVDEVDEQRAILTIESPVASCEVDTAAICREHACAGAMCGPPFPVPDDDVVVPGGCAGCGGASGAPAWAVVVLGLVRRLRTRMKSAR
jgi:M6 family metalloprotease-like protein